MPLVTIVIPTRNRVALLMQAVASALQQSCRSIEIIVVDEASEDGTAALLRERYPSVKVIRHDTARGPSAARNRGVSEASGDYILFLDDDDLLHPEHLESLLRETNALKSGEFVVSGRWRYFSKDPSGIRLGPIVSRREEKASAAKLLEFLDIAGEGSTCGPVVLWPRQVFERVQWDEELFTNGDVDFFGRTILAGYHIVGRPVGMAYYRQHSLERVAGTPSLRSVTSSTRFWIKWSALMDAHPQRDLFKKVVQTAFMSLMLAWSQYEDGSEWIPQLRDAYRRWGGERLFIPNPPRNPVKRVAIITALRLGGPLAVGRLLGMKSRRYGEAGHLATPSSSEDLDDVRAIAAFA